MGVTDTLEQLEKYFDMQLDRMGSFLAMKFGTLSKSWQELREGILAEVSDNPTWQKGLSLGMVLTEMQKSRSNNKAMSAERANHLTDELVKPRKSKKKQKR